MKEKKIAIIGYGRFGSLLAKILKPYGKIFIIDEQRKTLDGIIQINYQDLVSMDWVILAVPTSSLEKVVLNIRNFLKNGCLVMDVCSVKVYPCKILKKYLTKDVEIMGTHPMFGPDSAKYGLKGLQMIVCPLKINEQTYKEVVGLFKELQLNVIETSPKDHDKQGALNLSLVHFLGRGLNKMGIKQQEITTLGFERLLAVNETVNNDTRQLFIDIQKYNPYAKKIRNDLIRSLVYLNKKIS